MIERDVLRSATRRRIAACVGAVIERQDSEEDLATRALRSAVGGGELSHRLVAGENSLRPEQGREGAQRRIVDQHRVDIVAARHRNAILGAFELRLQRQEVGVGFQVGIILSHRKQPA